VIRLEVRCPHCKGPTHPRWFQVEHGRVRVTPEEGITFISGPSQPVPAPAPDVALAGFAGVQVHCKSHKTLLFVTETVVREGVQRAAASAHREAKVYAVDIQPRGDGARGGDLDVTSLTILNRRRGPRL